MNKAMLSECLEKTMSKKRREMGARKAPGIVFIALFKCVSISYLAVSARKKEGIVSSSSRVATFFTVACPQEVPVCFAIDSRKEAPAHSQESSPVARRT